MQPTTRTPMKMALLALGLTAAIAVVGIIVLALSLSTLIKTGVERMAPKILGVPVTLEDVDISLRSATSVQASLTQLTIGNPKGYETEHALSVPNIRIQFDWPSLLADTIIVEEVLIAEPSITFERLRLGSNLHDIQANITRNIQSDSDDEHAEEREEGYEKEEESESRVHIKIVTLKDAAMNVNLLGGKRGAMRLPLPDFTVRDIGKASEGASLPEASATIFDALYAAIIKAVTKSGTVSLESAQQLGQSAMDLGKAVEKAGKKLLKGLLDGL